MKVGRVGGGGGKWISHKIPTFSLKSVGIKIV